MRIFLNSITQIRVLYNNNSRRDGICEQVESRDGGSLSEENGDEDR